MGECCLCAGPCVPVPGSGGPVGVSVCAHHRVYRAAWFNAPLPIWGWLHLRHGFRVGAKRNRSVRQGDLSFKPDDADAFVPYAAFIQDMRRKYKVFLSIAQKTDAAAEYAYGDLAGGSRDQTWFYVCTSVDGAALVPLDRVDFAIPPDPVGAGIRNHTPDAWPVLPPFPAASEDRCVGHRVAYWDVFARSRREGFVLGYRLTYLEGRPLSFFVIKNSESAESVAATDSADSAETAETAVALVKAGDVFRETDVSALRSTLTPEERRVYDMFRVVIDVRPYQNLMRK
eukprot:jgi/Tetstr1/447344/TSEL_034781.t1